MVVETTGRPQDQASTIFTRIPPPIDIGRARNQLFDRIRKARRVRADADLERIAQTHAERMARLGRGEAGSITGSGALGVVSGRYRAVRALVVALTDVDQFSVDKIPRGRVVSHVGIGMAQGEHETLGPETAYVVVLMGLRK